MQIVAGDYIDASLGTAFCLSTMAAAGFGNLISDIAGTPPTPSPPTSAPLDTADPQADHACRSRPTRSPEVCVTCHGRAQGVVNQVRGAC